MKKNGIHNQRLSSAEEEFAYALSGGKAEEFKQKVNARQFPQNSYTAGENEQSNFDRLQPNNTEHYRRQEEGEAVKSNKQVYLNGVPMNIGAQPLRPQNYSQSPNKLRQPQLEAPSQNPIIIRNNEQVIINGAPQTVIIINESPTQTVKEDNSWQRDQRVGCCCISMHNTSCCCDYYCVNSCCRAIQGNNLCCYCYGADCVHCFAHHACRTCCLQKQMCECMLECCKHMPLCLLIDCLKGSSCCECLVNCCKEANCQCLGECCKNINCECLQNCDNQCIGNLCGAVCRGIGQVICCFFK